MNSIQWSLKPWKSLEVLAILNRGSQEIFARSGALENTTHMFMLHYGKFKR